MGSEPPRFLWPTDGLRPPDDVQHIVIEYGVTVIPRGSFQYLWSLCRVDIPNTVTDIRVDAFHECVSLQFIRFPDSVTTIGLQAFLRTGLRKVHLSNPIQRIGDDAFASCRELTHVSLGAIQPNASLEYAIFCGCAKLQNVTLPEGMAEIPFKMFAMCESLESIRLPKTVTKIGRQAFSRCIRLSFESIFKGDTQLTSIGTEAFAFSASSHIDVPDSVSEIGNCCFIANKNLTCIKFPNNPDLRVGHDRVLYGCPNILKVHFPPKIPQAIRRRILDDVNRFASFSKVQLNHAGEREFPNDIPAKCWPNLMGRDATERLWPSGKGYSYDEETLHVNEATKNSVLFKFIRRNVVQLLENQKPTTVKSNKKRPRRIVQQKLTSFR